MGERIHDPADSHADDQKKDEGPEDVSAALVGATAAEKPEGDGDHQSENYHGLKMVEPDLVGRYHALRARVTS